MSFIRPMKKNKFYEFVTSDTFSWWFGLGLIVVSIHRIMAGNFEGWIMPLVLGIILAVTGVVGWFMDRKTKT